MKNDANQVSLKEHFETVIQLNDRRYTEVNIEKEKALKIKEEADKVALQLAREIQTYKDEAHNGLLKQWQLERGTYVTIDKFDGALKPLVDYVSSAQGRSKGLSAGWTTLIGAVGLIGALIGIFSFLR